MGFARRYSWGGCSKRQQEGQSQKVPAAAGGASADARDTDAHDTENHRVRRTILPTGLSVLTSSLGHLAALLTDRSAFPLHWHPQLFLGERQSSLLDETVLPPSPTPKALPREGRKAGTLGGCRAVTFNSPHSPSGFEGQDGQGPTPTANGASS